jgi:hypothetical protein
MVLCAKTSRYNGSTDLWSAQSRSYYTLTMIWKKGFEAKIAIDLLSIATYCVADSPPNPILNDDAIEVGRVLYKKNTNRTHNPFGLVLYGPDYVVSHI